MKSQNIHGALPLDLRAEAIEDIISAPAVKIERIVSKGHASPDSGWYDQYENEWVMVVSRVLQMD